MTAATSLQHYRPARKKYAPKSDKEIQRAVKTAEMALKAVDKAKDGLGDGRGIIEFGSDLETSQRDAQDTIEHLLTLFLGRHELGIPEKNRWVKFDAKSAKTSDIIFRMMGMLTGDLQFQYVAPQGVARERKSDEIEAHLNGYPGWLYRKYGIRWDLQALFWQLLAGRSYIQQTYLPFYWDKTEMSRKKEEDDPSYNQRVDGYRGYMGPPIVVESLDPRTVFPLQTNLGATVYVKKYRVQRFEMVDAFKKAGVGIGFDAMGQVNQVYDLRKTPGLELPESSTDQNVTNGIDYWEYLDEEMCYYVCGDRVIHRYEHKGGIKIFPALGLQTGMKEFAFAAMGVLWPVRNEIPQYDFLRTLWMNKAYLDVFPPLIAELGETDSPLTDEHGNPIEWNLEPATIKQVRGRLSNALKDASSGVDFRALIEATAADIDLATIPNLARGMAGAQQPGYSINQLSQSMRTQWRPIIESRELQYSMLAEHYLYIVKNIIKRPVSYFTAVEANDAGKRHGAYVTVKPDDIEDYCQVIAHLEPELPIDKQGNMMTFAKLHLDSVLDWETYVREGLGKTNPEQLRQKVQRDAMMRAFLPAAAEDAMALGRVKLTNDIIRQRGLDGLNNIGNMDIQALKEARAKASAEAAAIANPQAAPQMAPPGTPTGGPPGELGPESGPGIPPTVGANPNNPAPAFRGP